MRHLICVFILLLCSTVIGNKAVVTNAGMYLFDMFGTGEGNFFSLGSEQSISKRFAVSIDLSYEKVMQYADRNRPLLIPEVGVSLMGNMQKWQPEFEVGGGIAIDLRSKKDREKSSVITTSIFDGVDDYFYVREEYFFKDKLIQSSVYLAPSIAYYITNDARIGARIKARSLTDLFFSMVIVEFSIFTKIDL